MRSKTRGELCNCLAVGAPEEHAQRARLLQSRTAPVCCAGCSLPSSSPEERNGGVGGSCHLAAAARRQVPMLPPPCRRRRAAVRRCSSGIDLLPGRVVSVVPDKIAETGRGTDVGGWTAAARARSRAKACRNVPLRERRTARWRLALRARSAPPPRQATRLLAGGAAPTE